MLDFSFVSMLTWVDDSADRVPSFGLWNPHLSTDGAPGDDEYYDQEEKEGLYIIRIVCLYVWMSQNLKASGLSAVGTNKTSRHTP